jgi:hypothetical protein
MLSVVSDGPAARRGSRSESAEQPARLSSCKDWQWGMASSLPQPVALILLQRGSGEGRDARAVQPEASRTSSSVKDDRQEASTTYEITMGMIFPFPKKS